MSGRWIEIPKQFHSLYHDGPFQKCVDCECDLLSGERLYMIERIFRGAEPIFEMAMCMECREKISEELSVDSMQRVNAYVEERFDSDARYDQTLQWPSDDVSPWLENCVLKKIPAADCRNYQIAGMCIGGNMSLDLLPIMVSDEAVEEMQKLLSKKTRDRLGEMVQDFFGMPSEFADGPEFKPVFW